jgi:hypothetical protein
MKLSFLPGDLYLLENMGEFVVQLKGQEIVRTRSQRQAVGEFNKLRLEMQQQFPERDLTEEEKKSLLEKAIADSLVGANSVRKRKRTTARSTRTFG